MANENLTREIDFENNRMEESKRLMDKFVIAYDRHMYPVQFANDELNRISSLISEWYTENPSLTTELFLIREDKIKDKAMSYGKAISQYCKQKGKKLSLFYKVVLPIFHLSDYLKLLHDGNFTNQHDLIIKNQIHEAYNTSDSGDKITNARRALVFFYLIENLRQPNQHFDIDKTEVARFLEIIQGKTSATTKIKNSNIYKALLKLYGDPSLASTEDLLFVQKLFKMISLSVIVDDIQLLLNKR